MRAIFSMAQAFVFLLGASAMVYFYAAKQRPVVGVALIFSVLMSIFIPTYVIGAFTGGVWVYFFLTFDDYD